MSVNIKKELAASAIVASLGAVGLFGAVNKGKCSRNNTSYIKKTSIKKKKKKRTSNQNKVKNRR